MESFTSDNDLCVSFSNVSGCDERRWSGYDRVEAIVVFASQGRSREAPAQPYGNVSDRSTSSFPLQVSVHPRAQERVLIGTELV